MPNHDYSKLHRHREQQLQHFEERRQALREGLESEFGEYGVTVEDRCDYDRRMLYRFALIRNDQEAELAWLEQDFFCCGENLFTQSVRDAKRQMGLPL